MASFRKIIPAALCAVFVAGAALPASANPLNHGGFGGPRWGGGGWHEHHDGWGRGLAIGGLGLATGALIASAYDHPRVDYVGPACGETVSTHYNAYGEKVKVVTQDPC